VTGRLLSVCKVDLVAYRINIVTDDCMSSGKCVGDYPAIFDFDDEELAVLVEAGPVMSDDDMIRAARNCPSRALVVFDENGKQIAT